MYTDCASLTKSIAIDMILLELVFVRGAESEYKLQLFMILTKNAMLFVPLRQSTVFFSPRAWCE